MNSNTNDFWQKLWRISLILLILTSLIAIFQFGDATVKNYIIYPRSTSTAIAVNATASVIAANTTATATIISANPYPSYLPGKGTLALYDSLTQPYLWDNMTNNSFGGSCQFTNGAYQVSQLKQNRNFPCYLEHAPTSDFSDFALEVEMKVLRGDCGGVIFRLSYQTGNSYELYVCPIPGNYGLFLYKNYTSTNVLPSNYKSTAIKKGLNTINLIAVVANGNSISAFVNHQKIISAIDNTNKHGQIGLFASYEYSSTVVLYANAKVWVL